MSPSADALARAAKLEALGLDARLAAAQSASARTYDAIYAALLACGTAVDDDGRKRAKLAYTGVVKLDAGGGVGDAGVLWDGIRAGKVDSGAKVEAGVAYLLGGGGVEGFEEAAGVGVSIGEADVVNCVASVLKNMKDELEEVRYRVNVGVIQKTVMKELRFADGKLVNRILREKIEEMLGPKTGADLEKVKKVKVKKVKAVVEERVEEAAADPFEGIPEKFEARELNSMQNSRELIEAHRTATGGKIVCRFPPEPNGYLHVGHSKAMFIDFGYAKKMGGDCILRFDDTNPAAEKTEYINSIQEMVAWMGHTPTRVTYSSDYFQELYDLAVELIRRDKAFVCHQTADEMQNDRKTMTDSPYRNRAIEESLRLFDDMRKGKFMEGEATLRMKIDMQAANPVMRDPVAYRILMTPHPHVGDKWCVYPSYDYTHCIVDSLEWITHSLCTLEFEIRRDSYYWLLEALDLYRPFVWEFARLNLAYTVMSKRKLKLLVDHNLVHGWDDPRMPTLSGMRRRGYPATALNRFCASVGATRNANTIGMHVLEHWIRVELDVSARRVFAVLRPLKLTISNFRGDEVLTAPNHPKDESMGTREVLLTRSLYIEQTDFRMEDCKGYYGLAPGKTAMLRFAYPVTIEQVVRDQTTGMPVELIGSFDYEKSSKPKGVLHWVNDSAPVFEARLYTTLFVSEDPASLGPTWLEDLNPESEVVLRHARIEKSVMPAEPGTRFQFERTGYFTADADSTPERSVFNLTVSLRDSR